MMPQLVYSFLGMSRKRLGIFLGFVSAMLAGFWLRGSVTTCSQPFRIHLLEQVDGWPCGYDIAFAARGS